MLNGYMARESLGTPALKVWEPLLACEFRISGQTKKSEDFETIQENLTIYGISTERVKAVVAGLWPVWMFIMLRGHR